MKLYLTNLLIFLCLAALFQVTYQNQCQGKYMVNREYQSCECVQGYFDDPSLKACQKCASKCHTCTLTHTNCLKCAEERNEVRLGCIYDGPLCYEGYYLDEQDYCSQCDSKCQTCVGKADNCLTCKDPSMDIRTQCSSDTPAPNDCDNGYYADFLGYCQQCAPQCKICSFAYNNCLECENSDTLISEGCLPKTQICQSGMFLNQVNQCEQCSSKCRKCSENADNCTVCSDQYKDVSQKCEVDLVKICQSGYYMNTYGYCRKCQDQCKECSINSNNCLVCQNQKMDIDFGCLEQGIVCKDGYYRNATGQCRKCDDRCESCVGFASNCLKCTYPQNNLQNSCQSTEISLGELECGAGQFMNSIKGCKKCSQYCKTCIHTENNCLECANSQYSVKNGCMHVNSLCDDGYFTNNLGDCQQCGDKCLRCALEAGKCTECFDSRMDVSKGCDSALPLSEIRCEQGKYNNQQGVCEQCESQCKSCQNQASNCLECKDPQMKLEDHCQAPTPSPKVECQPGYYEHGNGCLECSKECKTCTLTHVNCLECSDPSKDISKNCIDDAVSCEVGKYRDVQNYCSECDYKCKSCSAISSNCLECSYSYYKVENGCEPEINQQCQEGEYKDFSGVCQKCSSSCKSCNLSATNCIECKDSGKSRASGCLKDKIVCPQGYYYNMKECAKCSDKCLTCSESAENCEKCADETMDISQNCDVKLPGSGGSECGDGYYYDSYQNCQKCASQCKTCVYQATYCLVCAEETKEISKGCLSDNTCQKGEFFNQYYQCEKCDSKCKGCYGSAKNCSECVDSTMDIEFHCETKLPIKEKCQDGQFMNEYNQCQVCSSNCETCTSEHLCTICKNSNHTAPLCMQEQNCDSKCKYCKDDQLDQCILCANSTPSRQLEANCECPEGYTDGQNGECVAIPGYGCEQLSNDQKQCEKENECEWKDGQCKFSECHSIAQNVKLVKIQQGEYEFDEELKQFKTQLNVVKKNDNDKPIQQKCVTAELFNQLGLVTDFKLLSEFKNHFNEETQSINISWSVKDLEKVCQVYGIEQNGKGEKSMSYICGYSFVVLQKEQTIVSWNISYLISLNQQNLKSVTFRQLQIQKEMNTMRKEIGTKLEFFSEDFSQIQEQANQFVAGENIYVQQSFQDEKTKLYYQLEFQGAELLDSESQQLYEVEIVEKQINQDDQSSGQYVLQPKNSGKFTMIIKGKMMRKRQQQIANKRVHQTLSDEFQVSRSVESRFDIEIGGTEIVDGEDANGSSLLQISFTILSIVVLILL